MISCGNEESEKGEEKKEEKKEASQEGVLSDAVKYGKDPSLPESYSLQKAYLAPVEYFDSSKGLANDDDFAVSTFLNTDHEKNMFSPHCLHVNDFVYIVDLGWLYNVLKDVLKNGIILAENCPLKNYEMYYDKISIDMEKINNIPKASIGAKMVKLPLKKEVIIKHIKKALVEKKQAVISPTCILNESLLDNSGMIQDTVKEGGVQGFVGKSSERCLSKPYYAVIVGYNDATSSFTLKGYLGEKWKNKGFAEMTYDYYLKSFLTYEPTLYLESTGLDANVLEEQLTE